MKENGFGYVIIGIIIIIGCIFMSYYSNRTKELITIVYTNNNIAYKAVVYNDNKVNVTKEECVNVCTTSHEVYTYTKQDIEILLANFEKISELLRYYDYTLDHEYIVYFNEKDKALYNEDINNEQYDYMIRSLLNGETIISIN